MLSIIDFKRAFYHALLTCWITDTIHIQSVCEVRIYSHLNMKYSLGKCILLSVTRSVEYSNAGVNESIKMPLFLYVYD